MTLTPLEKEAIEFFRNGGAVPHNTHSPDAIEGWLYFGLVLLLRVGAKVRKKRLSPMAPQVRFKPDGSPVTKTDLAVENFIRDQIARYCPEAKLIGEESGGDLPATGPAVAIDPIDGTWAFINRIETIATSLLCLRDGRPFLGMVFNPVSGELAYGGENVKARILQISMFGEGDLGYDLPLDRAGSDRILINVHPNRHAHKLVQSLYDLWRRKKIGMVRSPGGSPALALLEVSKGSFGYVNLWSKRAAAPYDLAAGILLVRGAGGEVMDIQGQAVQLLDHAGPFIAIMVKNSDEPLIREIKDLLN